MDESPANHDELTFRFPQRAACWQLRTQRFQFGPLPRLMGIVNVTPDSFSDGGRFLDPSAAIEQALRLADDGADILDIGGESTRPYSDPVDAAEELRRVISVVQSVCEQTNVPVSIDTSKAAVVRESVAAGAEIINDVTALTGDAEMLSVAVDSAAGICAMHMRGNPQSMQDNPRYENVVEEILDYLRQRQHALEQAGVPRDRICLDPGIGFGKTHQHNIDLIRGAEKFHELGRPILVGHSRKGFIGRVLKSHGIDPGKQRVAGTIGVALSLARAGIQIIRVHDVKPVREALLLFEATGGLDGTKSPLPN